MLYQPGDHLRVHRRRYGVPYTHHAINFPDGRLVEFGGSTANKPAMRVDFGSFERFASGDRVDVVRHDDHDAALAMRHAEWLVSCPPTRRYNGVGFNCEHVARWCATGWETRACRYDIASSAANPCSSDYCSCSALLGRSLRIDGRRPGWSW